MHHNAILMCHCEGAKRRGNLLQQLTISPEALCYPGGHCEIATSAFGLLAMTNLGASRHRIHAANVATLHGGHNPQGHAASVRRQSRQRLRSDRRYRRNWSARFYRQPVRIGSIIAGHGCPRSCHCNIIPAVLPLPSGSGCAGRLVDAGLGQRAVCGGIAQGLQGRRRGRPASG